MTDAEDKPYFGQIQERLDEIKDLLEQSHEASEAIHAEAQAVLEAHAETAQEYVRQVDEPEPPDFHPVLSAPEGTSVRDLPDGVAVGLEPARGGAKGFEVMGNGHRGIVEADGTIHLATANGLDLVIRFPDKEELERDTGPDDPVTTLCEERD